MQKVTMEEIQETLAKVMGNYVVYQSINENDVIPILITDGVPEMLGYTKEELNTLFQNKALAEIWGMDYTQVGEHIGKLKMGEKEVSFTTQLRHKTMGYTWVHIRTKLLGLMDEKMVGVAELISVDDAAGIVGKLTDQSSRMVYVLDAESFKILYANDKYLEWTKLSRGEVLAQHCHKICPHSEKNGKVCSNCIVLRAYQNGGVLETTEQDGEQVFNIGVKKLDWGGHEAYAVSALDVTERKLDERRRLDAYNRRINTSLATIASSYLIYEANLTQNTVQVLHMPEGPAHFPKKGYYDGMIGWILGRISLEENRKTFGEKFKRETLLDDFYAGHMSVSTETIYTRAQEDDTLLRVTAYLRQNPVTKDVEATLQFEDISSEYARKLLAEYMIGHAFDSVAIIDLKYDRIAILNRNEISEQDLSDSHPYGAHMHASVDVKILKEDRELFRKNSSIANIRNNLKNQDYYSFTAHTIEKDGTVKLERFGYAYLNAYRQTVVATIEDVTEDFEIDHLTGLYNYKGFCIRASEMIKNNPDKNFAILYFNIKGFKAVNELFGNEVGDKVLQEMTGYLKKSSIKAQLIGRIAVTDHFICLAEEKNVEFSEIKNLCHMHMVIDDRKISIRGRCGIYMVTDRDMGVDRMCDQAKIAKQNVQDEFVKPYAVFDEKIKEAYLTRTSAVTIVNQALENSEFCVYYQPIFDAKTGELASAEALVRWNRPGVGVVSPGLFVPALEENGYISLVDRFVAKTVRTFQQRRMEQNRYSVPISINLSWIDFYDENMMNSVMEDIAVLDGHGGMLRYEVTETSWAAMNNRSSVALKEMRDKGVKILLDDFGSGFSSFSTIRDYDFDILKIDMGFVQKLGTDKKVDGIICAIINMAHHIHATVVAEGVETEAQRKFLAENGCDYLQGYYFSKPIPEEEFLAMLDQHKVSKKK